jgi:CRISPR-associated exonuclease Cas4
MHPEEQLLPLSALQHLLYCERQCALIHLEQVWAENQFTTEGNQMHKKAHDGPDESRPGIRITRGLPVVSHRLGISGVCDVVEFHAPAGGDFKPQISDFKSTQSVVPVEYKRGKPKAHRADEVQVAAQAMALEEMLGIDIPLGLIFYGKTRRRSEVPIDDPLRALCTALAERLHELIDSRLTPPAVYESRKCDACSLIDICQPHAQRFKNGAAAWFASNLKSEISDLKSTDP